MGELIQFQYTIKDRIFCRGQQSVYVDSNKVVVLGERNDWMIYDEHLRGFVKTEAFMVNYNGVEYGSENGDSGLISACESCGNSSGIFSPEFENEFE